MGCVGRWTNIDQISPRLWRPPTGKKPYLWLLHLHSGRDGTGWHQPTGIPHSHCILRRTVVDYRPRWRPSCVRSTAPIYRLSGHIRAIKTSTADIRLGRHLWALEHCDRISTGDADTPTSYVARIHWKARVSSQILRRYSNTAPILPDTYSICIPRFFEFKKENNIWCS